MSEGKAGEIKGYGNSESRGSALIIDTVQLPRTEGHSVHIETSKEQLAFSFAEYAQKMGLDHDEAMTFFHEKVDIHFGEVRNVKIEYPGVIDKLLAKSIRKITAGGAMACVGPRLDGRILLCIDTKKISTLLPKLRKKEAYDAGDYSQMTSEERIAAFQQTVETVTEHEFWHIIQLKEEKVRFDKYLDKSLLAQRLLGGYILVASAMYAIDDIRPFTIPASVAFGCALVMVTKDTAWVEADAVEAQKKALGMELKSPFKFTIEKDSPNPN